MTDRSIVMAEAMTYIDDRFLTEAHPEACGTSRKEVDRARTMKRLAAVACLCIVAIGAFQLHKLWDFHFLGVSGSMKPEAGIPVDDLHPGDEDGNSGNSGENEGQYPTEDEMSTEGTDTTETCPEEATDRLSS